MSSSGAVDRLVLAALLTLVSSCSGNTEAGSGGSGGSGGPIPPPAQGGLRMNFRPSSLPTGACSIGTNIVGIAVGGAYPRYTSGNPGQRVIDGQDGAEVSCKVAGSSQFAVSATIRKEGASFSVAADVASGGMGTGQVTASHPLTTLRPFAPARSLNDPDCEFRVDETPLEVSVGRIWAAFSCPVVRDEQDVNVACALDGEFVLENCDR
jgi:hypothetical protein